MNGGAVDAGCILAGGRRSGGNRGARIDKYEMTARYGLLSRRMGQCGRKSKDVALSLEIAAFRPIEQRRHADRRQPVPIEQGAPWLHQYEGVHGQRIRRSLADRVGPSAIGRHAVASLRIVDTVAAIGRQVSQAGSRPRDDQRDSPAVGKPHHAEAVRIGMRCEAWIGQHCIERLVNLAWPIFESCASGLGSGVKRRDHDKTLARQ
jgi:hypothetical protein